MSPAKIKTDVKANAPSGVATGILRRMVAGEMLLGDRQFPFAFKYRISGAFDHLKGTHVGAGPVGVTIIDDLVTRGLVTASHRVASKDTIIYAVTDAGRAFAKHGPTIEPDAQADWTLDVGYVHPPLPPKEPRATKKRGAR